jgi:hypothetical protein
MKTKLFLICIVFGYLYSGCKKDRDDIIKDPIFEDGILNLQNFAASLPPHARVIVDHPSESPGSYFNADLSNASKLDGLWPGWCVQTGVGISPGRKTTTTVYSSYANIPGYENDFFIRLNWIINQKFIEKGFTYGEIQIAIWTLKHGHTVFNENVKVELDNTRPPNLFDPDSIGPWDAEKVNEILTLAGVISDYLPGMGGLIGVVFISEEHQDIIVEYTLPAN